MTPRQRIMADVEQIAKAHGVTVGQIMSPLRIRHIVRARHAAMWLVWWKYRMSLPRTAHFFGRSDHSTAAFGVGKHMIRCGMEHPWITAYARRKEKRARSAYTPQKSDRNLSIQSRHSFSCGNRAVDNVDSANSLYPCNSNHFSVSDMICSEQEIGRMRDEDDTFEQIGVATERVVKRLQTKIEDGHGGHHSSAQDRGRTRGATRRADDASDGRAAA